ncbi:MAG: cell division protein FtsZ [Epsilonproteobacteria bacterium]|nr:MAG: cell division protein FtsZ [Campylobacterota bacterium]
MNSLFDTKHIKESLPSDKLEGNFAKISAIGVGGGGCNMINHMIDQGIEKIDLVVANTDQQVLDISKAPKTIQLGRELTKGLGAGMDPDKGRDSALEAYQELLELFKDAGIVFVAAGLGGGTGTGAAPIVAKAAKESGALTVSVITKPFSWEGKKRATIANVGLEELKEVSDSIIIVPNERLLEIVDDNIGFKDAFKVVDDVLYQAVNGMSEVILNHGNGDINTDFADVQRIMKHKGMALMGIGKAKGEDAVMNALQDAINSPLLDKISLSGAKGIVIHFHMHPTVPMQEIGRVMKQLDDSLDNDTELIFGTTTDEELNGKEIKITIVATGFDNNPNQNLNTQSTTADEPKLEQTNKNYYSIPPLMRDYNIKYHL